MKEHEFLDLRFRVFFCRLFRCLIPKCWFLLIHVLFFPCILVTELHSKLCLDAGEIMSFPCFRWISSASSCVLWLSNNVLSNFVVEKGWC
jgi:hypothetical protein